METRQSRTNKSFRQIALVTIVLGGIGAFAGISLYEDDESNVKNAIVLAPANTPSLTTNQTTWNDNPLQKLAANMPVSNQAFPQSNLIVNPNKLLSTDDHSQSFNSLTPASGEAMAAIEMPRDFVPNSATGSTENAPFSRINLPEFSTGQKAINLLANDLNAVAQWYGMSAEALKVLLLNDKTLHIDRKGRMLNIDVGVNQDVNNQSTSSGIVMLGATAIAQASSAMGIATALDQTFTLHSRPNSTRVLYLNFTGLAADPPFTLDAVPGTFNDLERTMIQRIWSRVQEDYAPFDVDITTELPVTLTGKIGTSILITKRTSGSGGYAYLNTFGTLNPKAPPAFCFQNNLSNGEKPIAECISHELGHTLGLSHQGTSSTGYYGGQGSGETGWAPIMGVSYYKNLTQWAKGEYTNANNKEDAYAVMLRQKLTPRVDDHGNTIATADNMVSTNASGLNNLKATGVIETPTDIDMFRFSSGAGSVTFTLAGAALGGNLDAALQILDSSGKVLAVSNDPNTLGTSISVTLAVSGTYYLSVAGAGKDSPLLTGYSNYGSLGQYTIVGTSPLTTPAPAIVLASSVTTGKGPFLVSFDASNTETSTSKISAYLWTFGDGTATASFSKLQHSYVKVGTYTTVLKVTDSVGRTATKEVKVVVN